MSEQLDMFAHAAPVAPPRALSPSGSAAYDAAIASLLERVQAAGRMRYELLERETQAELAACAAEEAAFLGPWPEPAQHPHQRAMDMLLLAMETQLPGRGRLVHGERAGEIFGDAMGRPFDTADTDALLGVMVERGLVRQVAGCVPTFSQRCNSVVGGACAQCRPPYASWAGTVCLSWHYFARCQWAA